MDSESKKRIIGKKSQNNNIEKVTPRLLDVNSAAEYLAISRASVYKLCESGKLASVKIFSRRLFHIVDLCEYADNLRYNKNYN